VLLTDIIVVIVWRDVSLVQVTIGCHCVPGPSGVFSDSADVIPVVSGTGVVSHVV